MKRWLVFALSLLFVQNLFGQAAMPTTGVLTRMTMIDTGSERGSIFSIDVDGREYWITAKHILTGATHPPYGVVTGKYASVKILNPEAEGESWLPVKFSVIDTGTDIDIVVLAPASLLLQKPVPSVPTDSAGAVLGGECSFLGFPYGGGWQAHFDGGSSYWMPFVKHCYISAMSTAEPRIWVLDGINNPGFSGGPVVFRTGTDQKMFAVISGYHLEPADVVSSAARTQRQSKPPKTAPRLKVNLNSGFILAYDIGYAIKAIEANPIGPQRPAQ